MKKMKNVWLIVLLTISGMVAAQNYGVEASYVSSETNTNGVATGFQVGPVAEAQLIGPLSLEYGIKYQLLMQTSDVLFTTNKYTGHFMQVPLRLKVGFPLGSNLKLIAFGGPNIDVGLMETNVLGSAVSVTTQLYEIDADDNNKPDFSRFNLQLGVGGGLKYHNLQLKVSYDWGMIDLNNREDFTKNRNQLTLTAGFIL